MDALEKSIRLLISAYDKDEEFSTSSISEALDSDYWETDRILRKLGQEGFIEPVTNDWTKKV
jgi:hypothetical protein